jgi:hypothetical protein
LGTLSEGKKYFSTAVGVADVPKLKEATAGEWFRCIDQAMAAVEIDAFPRAQEKARHVRGDTGSSRHERETGRVVEMQDFSKLSCAK